MSVLTVLLVAEAQQPDKKQLSGGSLWGCHLSWGVEAGRATPDAGILHFLPAQQNRTPREDRAKAGLRTSRPDS